MALLIADTGKFVKGTESRSIPVFLWLVIPVAVMAAQTVLEIILPARVLSPMLSEGGPHETFQAVFSGLACMLSIRLFFQVNEPLHRFWMLCAALGCFYITGEELSWGQQIFGWITPEFWTEVNDQQETNLHNTSDWLDQKPRLLLFIGIMVGGLLIPALRKWKPLLLPVKYQSLYPSNLLIPAALGVTVPYFMQEMAEFLKIHLFYRVSEVQELYMYYFVLLYLLDFKKRIISQDFLIK